MVHISQTELKHKHPPTSVWYKNVALPGKSIGMEQNK